MKRPTPEPFEYIFIDVADPIFGAQLGKATLRVHTRTKCKGQPCCIHNPTQGPMVTWPLNWRADRGLMERLCPHGVGHPDPDDMKVKRSPLGGLHGCPCGCCGDTNQLTQQDADDLIESYGQMVRGEGRVLYPSPPSPDELQ